MSSPPDPPGDDGSISSVLITGPIDALSVLADAPEIDIVRGTITDVDDQTRTAVAYVTQAAISRLQSSGIDVTPLDDPATQQGALGRGASAIRADAKAADYMDTSSIDDALQGLATQYGLTCAKLYLDQRTWDLQRVPYVRIQKGDSSSAIPVLFTGGLHPRELAPPDALLSFCNKLLDADFTGMGIVYPPFTDASGTRYGQYTVSAAAASNILNKFSLFVVPCANPDGRDYVQMVDDDDHKFWRMNRRPPAPTCWGVNINRNFPFVWDADTYYAPSAIGKIYVSEDPCDDQFRGYPIPEPETLNLVHLVAQQGIQYLVDVHMFGRKVYYPWGMERNQTTDPQQNFSNHSFDGKRDGPGGNVYGEYLPNNSTSTPDARGQLLTRLTQLAGAMVAEIKTSAGTNPTAIARSTYTAVQAGVDAPTTGSFDDYTFGQQFLYSTLPTSCAYTLECGYKRPDLGDTDGGFLPDRVTQYPKIEREVHAALFGLLNAI